MKKLEIIAIVAQLSEENRKKRMKIVAHKEREDSKQQKIVMKNVEKCFDVERFVGSIVVAVFVFTPKQNNSLTV